jgi:hypothetical protein
VVWKWLWGIRRGLRKLIRLRIGLMNAKCFEIVCSRWMRVKGCLWSVSWLDIMSWNLSSWDMFSYSDEPPCDSFFVNRNFSFYNAWATTPKFLAEFLAFGELQHAFWTSWVKIPADSSLGFIWKPFISYMLGSGDTLQ